MDTYDHGRIGNLMICIKTIHKVNSLRSQSEALKAKQNDLQMLEHVD